MFHNYHLLINENGLPVFDSENFLVRATNFHFLSIPPKSFHFSSDLSRIDAMGCKILARRGPRAAALYLAS